MANTAHQYPLPNKNNDVVEDINALRTAFGKIDVDVNDLEQKIGAKEETVSDLENRAVHCSERIDNSEIQNIEASRYVVVNAEGNGFECLDGGGDIGGTINQCSIKRTDENFDTAWGNILDVSKNGLTVQENVNTSGANEIHVFSDILEIDNASQLPKVELINFQEDSDRTLESNESVILRDYFESVEESDQLATAENFGMVKIGEGINVNNGVISADIIQKATTETEGTVKIGEGLVVDNGVISRDVINVADYNTYGVVKIGRNLNVNSSGELEIDMGSSGVIYDLGRIKVCSNGVVDLEEKVLKYRLTIEDDLIIQFNYSFAPSQDYSFILELISDGSHLVAFNENLAPKISPLPINRGITKLTFSKKLGLPYYNVEVSRLDAPAPVLLTAKEDVRYKFLMNAPSGSSGNPHLLLKDYYDSIYTAKELYFEFFTLVCVDYVKYWSRSSSVAMRKFVFEGSNDNKNWTTLIYKENEICYGQIYTERKGCFRYYKLTIDYSGDDNKPSGVMLFGTEIDNNEYEVTNLTPYMSSNIAPYATVTASSMTSGSAADITDDNTATYMRITSSNNSRWVKYELTEPAVANLLELNFTSTNTQANWFKLEGSNDNEDWELLLERQYPLDSIFQGGYRIFFYYMENETAYKYYKLTCLATNDSSDNWDLTGFKLFFINRGNGKPHFYSLVPTLSSNSQDGYEVTASSYYSSYSHYPYDAFDGSSGADNKWASAEGDVNGAWLKIELPEAAAANTFQIQSPNEGYRERAPKKFKIQGSNDDTVWTDLISETNLSWLQNQIRKWNIENETAFKFYRILVEENNGANFVDIGEFTIGRTIREYKRYLDKYDYLVPVMSSNSQDGYVVSASSESNADYVTWHMFDRNSNTSWSTANNTPSATIQITMPTAKILNRLTVQPRPGYPSLAFGTMVIYGSNDGNTWTELLNDSAISAWTNNVSKTWEINNSTAYSYYKLEVTPYDGIGISVADINLIHNYQITEY